MNGREEHQDHHGLALVCHELGWELQLDHEVPDGCPHDFCFPIVTSLEQTERIHVLSQEVPKLAQQWLVQRVLLNLFEIYQDHLFLTAVIAVLLDRAIAILILGCGFWFGFCLATTCTRYMKLIICPRRWINLLILCLLLVD